MANIYFVEFKDTDISWEDAYKNGTTEDITVYGLDNALKLARAYCGRVWSTTIEEENNDGILLYNEMVHDDNW